MQAPTLPPHHIFASGTDVDRILTNQARIEDKVDRALALLTLITKETTMADVNTAQIKQEVADLIADVKQESDGKAAVQKLVTGLVGHVSNLTSELRAAIANGANPQDLNDIAAGLSTVLAGVDANKAADAAIANTPIDPNAGNAPTDPNAPAPSIASISPVSGAAAGGDTVVITGAGFTGATAVEFGSVNAASFTVDSDTQISAVTPALTADGYSVQVVGPSGTGQSPTQFTAA